MLSLIYDNDGPIDNRQVLHIALLAVISAYLNGQITVKELSHFHMWGVYDGHKLKERYGNHPFFELETFLTFSLAEFDGPEDWKCSWREKGIDFNEERLREELRRFTGIGITTGSSNIILTEVKVPAEWSLQP